MEGKIMAKYRKKPVVIDARLFDPRVDHDEAVEVCKWAGGIPSGGLSHEEGCVIHTLEGDHLARFGDYIIKGVKGEFYPCKPGIFEATYELIEE
jgi:hypothetical protein